MFKSLFPILEKASLSFTISAKGYIISVTVTPKSTKNNKSNESISNTPLVSSGTAEELDQHFVTDITKALGEAVGYYSNSEEFVAAVKEKADGEKAKIKKEKSDPIEKNKNETIEGTDTKTKSPVLTAAQKKLVPKASEAVEKAKKTPDADMVEFLKKQTVKMYTDAKMPEDLIKALEKEFDDIPEKVPAATNGEMFPDHTEEGITGSNNESNDSHEEDDTNDEEHNDHEIVQTAGDDDIF